ncbi:MAG: serpin family protein [Actinomycetes bacterium]
MTRQPTDAGTAAAHAGFALRLHHALAPPDGSGTACSPWSVSSALGALAPGADDGTRHEIARALGVGVDGLDRMAAQAHEVTRRPGTEGVEAALAVATTLWLDEEVTPRPDFTGALAGWPGARVGSTAIQRDPEHARVEVNADVAATTRGLVPEILPSGGLRSDDVAVLVNALYLLEAWVEPFHAADTAPAPFHRPDGVTHVPTMRGAREVPYAHTDGWQYAALPLYHGLHAEVLLADAPLTEAERDLDGPALDRLRAHAVQHRLTLSLPRFPVTGGGGLVGALQALGVRRLFERGAAPLPRVVQETAVFVSRAFHRAVLRVDERGVEGAAATAMVMNPVMFQPMAAATMRVDRPFLVLVTHRNTGAVLFLARVVDP